MDCSGGGSCGVRGPVQRVPNHQHADVVFAGVFAVDFSRCHRSGPLGEVAKPSEGLKGSFLVVVIGDLGGHDVVLASGSKGIVIPLMGPALVSGLCDYTGGTLDRVGGAFIG